MERRQGLKGRVLVVDDGQEVRSAVNVALREDFDVASAENLARGRELLESGGFDVVFLDLMLPDGNGLDLLEELRARDQELAIVVITAHGTLENAIRALNQGASFYLQKPFRRESVLACARQMADRTRLLRENRKLMRDLRATLDDLKHSQVELVKNEKLAAVGRLAAGMAHEINNPLQAVIGFADLLARTVDEERSRSDLRMITANAERIRRIVRGMMAFGRAGGGPRQAVAVNEVLRRALEEALRESLPRHVSIHEDLDPQDPEVQANESYLQQVFLNILINALQAMPAGGELNMRSRVEGRTVVVRVSDTGVGIGREQQARVFDPFYTTRQTGDGVGLGLSIAYGIIKDYGGHIELESEPGRGTSLTVRLPLPGVEELALPAELLGEDLLQVLIVDDDDGAREVLARIIASSPRQHCEVATAASAEQALEQMDTGRFDVVFTDIKMSGMDGMEFLKAAKGRSPQTRFVMMTGYTELYSAKDAMRSGADEYITKPLHFNEVLMVLDKMVLRAS